MFESILSLLVESAESAFIEVTVFVGAVLIIFEYINYKKNGGFIKKIENSKKTQPIIGALLGLTPGCGGAIFVMPLFPKGTITFGTVVATLIATMGDSSFVLISTMPSKWVLVSILSFMVAIIMGYLIDTTNLGNKLLADIQKEEESHIIVEKEHIKNKDDHNLQIKESGSDGINHIGHEEGDRIDMILHHEIRGHQDINTIGYKITHMLYPIFWTFIGIGIILGILDLLQVDINNLLIPNLGTFIGVLGTFICLLTMFMSNKFVQNHTHEESELKLENFKETLIHSAQETAFVATWVFLAYFTYEMFILFLGKGTYSIGENLMASFLTQQGIYSVIVGALIGIIPGCGPQIIFVTLYTKGLLPFSALLANAISQDGDALFPLIAVHRKSAVWATILNTIPALIVGVIAYFIEMNFF